METLSGVMSIFHMLIWNISLHMDNSYMSVYVCQNFSVCILNTWAHYFLNYTSIENLATWGEELTHWKRPWCWERLKAGGEGDDRGWDGLMASLTQWTRLWTGCRSWWQRSLACCRPLGHKQWDMTKQLNWIES